MAGHHKTSLPSINTANWGCREENTTANHLLDIMKNESSFTINKINKILSKNYQKMVDLIGVGRFQPYYLLLVRNDMISELGKIEVNSKSTRTHATSIIMMTHRTFINLQYDENNEFPKI